MHSEESDENSLVHHIEMHVHNSMNVQSIRFTK